MVRTLDLGLPMNDDLAMTNPFEEPNERFLKKQRNALGTESEEMS